MQVGTVQLSKKLYAQAAYVSEVTTGIVDRHLKAFRTPARWPWNCSRARAVPPAGCRAVAACRPIRLPKYLREAHCQMAASNQIWLRAFAKMQVD